MNEFLKDISGLWRPHRGQREFLLAKAPYRALTYGRRWEETDTRVSILPSRKSGERWVD